MGIPLVGGSVALRRAKGTGDVLLAFLCEASLQRSCESVDRREGVSTLLVGGDVAILRISTVIFLV